MVGNIEIHRTLPVINGFIAVPDVGYVSGKRNMVTLDEGVAAIPGSERSRAGSTIQSPRTIKLPLQRPQNGIPDYFAQLRAIS